MTKFKTNEEILEFLKNVTIKTFFNNKELKEIRRSLDCVSNDEVKHVQKIIKIMKQRDFDPYNNYPVFIQFEKEFVNNKSDKIKKEYERRITRWKKRERDIEDSL